jgi:hypothetical protein
MEECGRLLQLLDPKEKSTKYAFIGFARARANLSTLGVDKNLLTVLHIEPQFLSHPACCLYSSLFTVPQKIKKLSDNTNTFKRELKKFLLLGSFYSIEEFYEWTSMRNLYAVYL